MSDTTSQHGTAPGDRPIDEYIRKGIVIVDKPKGPTSHQISAWVRNMAGAEKAGHGGTLDPNVSGVLPIGFDDALKALQALLLDSKEYVAVMKLHGDVDRKAVEKIFKDFTGPLYQTPPVRSAVKRERRIRTIHKMEILEIKEGNVLFRVVCESGTYIRTLCVDMGDALSVGGHMLELRRIRSATFDEGQAVKLQELKDAFVALEEDGDEEHLRKIVHPFERLLDHLPKLYVKDSAVDAICHGADVAVPGINRIEGKFGKGDTVAVLSQKGEGISIGEAKMPSSQILEVRKGNAINLTRVFMAPGTYPKLWKRGSQ